MPNYAGYGGYAYGGGPYGGGRSAGPIKWALNVRTFEQQQDGSWRLVLQHSFFGATQEEAQGIFQAHMRTDQFLRDCTTSGHWQNVTCRSEATWQQL